MFFKCFFTLLLCAAAQWGLAQTGHVTGLVQDPSGEPIIGANVQLLDSYQGSATDFNGRFSIPSVPPGRHRLRITYISYAPQTKEIEVNIGHSLEVVVTLQESGYILPPTVINNRAADDAPIAKTTLSKEELERNNLGVDIPILLQFTPSVVTTSDAGNGVGYTGLRIRGSDAERINVTINGIPLNDAESQGVFWVNMPDFASSLSSLQIQRGVGTSTNGAGAFGASLNLQTNDLREEPYGEIGNSYGSFNTRRHSASFGTGLIDGHWSLDGRLSHILSDGYIDRSSSNLRSYFFSGAYTGAKTSIRANIFSGKEITQQAWYGTPSVRLNNDSAGIEEYILANGLSPAQAENLRRSDRRYNHYLYENEVDNYQQTHYQLHINQQISDKVHLKGAAFLTQGEGYFEQYMDDAAPFEDTDLAFYGIDYPVVGGDTIRNSDVIRRRWLDNDFYGLTYSLNWQQNGRSSLNIGGALSNYEGAHFGEVIWARYAGDSEIRDRYYENDARKLDWNTYAKWQYRPVEDLQLFVDLQHRYVSYSFEGVDFRGLPLEQTVQHHFFNPKLGLSYRPSAKHRYYTSFSVANREPNRNDFVESPPTQRPLPETLYDTELGYEWRGQNLSLSANGYFMYYRNQLVATGVLNDVGASVRQNIPESYRTGLELQGLWRILPYLDLNANATFSQNKISRFSSFVDNWDEGGQNELRYENTDLAFSPNLVGGSELTWHILGVKAWKRSVKHGLDLSWLSKYVGRQYIDNTQALERSIDPYFVQDLRLRYRLKESIAQEVALTFWLRNFSNVTYSGNAWVYRYFSAGEYRRLDGYYPQAGTNFLLGLNVKF